MKYRVIVKSSFSAAHRVLLPSGEWEPLHGHNYKVEVCVIGDNLQKNDMLIDFFDLKKVVENVILNLHNTNLNENPSLSGVIPTAENVARFIFDSIKKNINYDVEYVKLDETDEFSVIVSSD